MHPNKTYREKTRQVAYEVPKVNLKGCLEKNDDINTLRFRIDDDIW